MKTVKIVGLILSAMLLLGNVLAASAADGQKTEEPAKPGYEKDVGKYFENEGINGKVTQQTCDRYVPVAPTWNRAPGHIKLVMQALDANPEMTAEEILALDIRDVVELTGRNENENAREKNAVYKEKAGALKTEYARLFELRQEIERLEDQLKGEMTEEEKIALQSQLAEKIAEMKALRDEYKEKLDAIKDERRESRTAENQGKSKEKGNPHAPGLGKLHSCLQGKTEHK